MDLTLEPEIPIEQYAECVAYLNNKPVFRGYAETYEVDSTQQQFTLVGVEELLNDKCSPMYFYPVDSITFTDLLADTITVDSDPGLLALANSAVPPGLEYEMYNTTKNIVKYAGGGTDSRFSTCNFYYISYLGVKQMQEAPNLVDMLGYDCSFYRDVNDLYLRIEYQYERGFADLGGVLAENVFDTKIRLGTVETGDDTIHGDEQLDGSAYGDEIVDLCWSHGRTIKFREGPVYTHMDVMLVD